MYAIRSYYVSSGTVITESFQFQYGAIGSGIVIGSVVALGNFNSSMVRLGAFQRVS